MLPSGDGGSHDGSRSWAAHGPATDAARGYRLCVDADGTTSLRHVSQACGDLYGCAPQEAISDVRVFLDAVHADDRKAYDDEWSRSLRTLRPVRWQGRIVCQDQLQRTVLMTAVPLRMPDGSTEWDGAVDELHTARAPVTSDPAGSTFPADVLATLAHDVGDPLSAALLCAELAADELDRRSRRRPLTVDDEAVRTCLRVVVRQGRLLADLREDLLVVAAEAATRRVETVPTVEVASHLQAIAGLVPPHVRTAVSCSPRVRCAIESDHLLQMLSHLVSNAVRFARTQVTLSAWTTEERVSIAVHDDGPGVPDHVLERLFRRHATVDGSSSRLGAGLGLCLVRTIANANHGTVHHTHGRPGTLLTLSLPAASEQPLTG